MKKLTDAEKFTVYNALRVAKEEYVKHATNLRNVAHSEGEKVSPGAERLARQFVKQAEECDALLNVFG